MWHSDSASWVRDQLLERGAEPEGIAAGYPMATFPSHESRAGTYTRLCKEAGLGAPDDSVATGDREATVVEDAVGFGLVFRKAG